MRLGDRSKGLVAGLLLPLLPVGLACVYGRIPLAFYRVSAQVSLHGRVPGWLGAASLILGAAGLLILVRGAWRDAGSVLRGAALTIVALEASVSALLVYSAYTSSVGLRMPLVSLLLAERSLWLALLLPAIPLLPLAAALYYWRTWRRRGASAPRGREELLLGASLAAAWLSVLIPHLPRVNPSGIPVATDTRFHVEWLRIMEREGLWGGLRELAPKMRPLYMVFLYVFHRALPGVEPRTLLDIVMPGTGFALLAVATYVLAGAGGARPGLASLLSVLYWAPMFVYGGFQTNLYSLPMALTLFYLLYHERRRAASILAVALGLWHPWSLAYVSVAAALMAAAKKRASIAAPLLAGWAATLAVDMYLLGGLRPPAANVVRPAEPSFPDPVFALYIYVWGTLARPEALIPAAYVLARGGDSWDLWMAAAGFLGFAPLRPAPSYRVLMQAPVPLLAGRLEEGSVVAMMLAASAASWLFFLLVSPPLY